MRAKLYLSSCLIASFVLLAGCGSTAATSGTPPPPIQPTYTAKAKYAYVAISSGSINEYSISTAGLWTQIASINSAPGAIFVGSSLALDPQNRFLYSIAGGDSNSVISMYTISSTTGLLTATNPASITIAGTLSQGIAVDGLGKFVYTADTDSSTVNSLAINQITGLLTPTTVPSIAGPRQADGVNTDASGKYVYISGQFGNINQYIIDPNTGNLTPNNPASAAGGPGAFVGTINAAGTFFYSPPGVDVSYLAILSIDPTTGLLLGGPQNDTTTVDGPSSVALTSDGKYAYVVSRIDNTIAMYSVDPGTGLLTSLGAAVASGSTLANTIVIDPGNQLAYVTCIGGAVVTFGIKSDGTLTQLSSITITGSAPQVAVLIP